jgi:UDP-N-acetylglucosamine transferase subunit ALG13
MIFLTVGSQFPFDRLVKAVDQAFEGGQLNGEMYGQIGETSYQPRNFRAVPYMEKQAFDDCMQEASAIISHAGIGTISMALDRGKPLLVMPRLKIHGEAVNDHQMAIVRKFEEQGHMLVAYDVDELSEKIKRLKTFVGTKRKARPEAVAQRIAEFLSELVNRSGRR